MFRLVIIAISVSLAYGASLDAIIGDDYIRVIGGEEIDILESPWQVAIQREYSHEGDFYLVCSGSIIGLNYILTTGSCVHGVPIGALRARAGSNSHKEGGSVYLLSEMIIHPNFSIQTYDYDVAVLTTRLAISTSALVSSATLPTPGIEIPTGSFGSSTGWGSYEPSNPSLSDHLRQIEVPILEQAACGSVFSEERMTPRMVCAGGETGHGACRGDSGNPLVISRVLVGVLSRTGLCGVAGQPGVYTNIPVVVEWVNSQMRRR